MTSFLDELKDTAAEGLGGMVERGKTGFELSRLRSQLRKLERERQERLSQLGECVFSMIQAGNLDSQVIRSKCEPVTQIDLRVSQLKVQMAELDKGGNRAGGANSPIAWCSCGEAFNAVSRFCRGCGKNVESVVAAARQEEKLEIILQCECGAALSDSKFCPECGRPTAKPRPAEGTPESTSTMREPRVELTNGTKACPVCSCEISAAAKFCGHCGKSTEPGVAAARQEEERLEIVLQCECGAALSDTAKFCLGCGKPAAKPSPALRALESAGSKLQIEPPREAKSCPFCSGEVPAAAKFCRHCGKSLSPADVA